MLSRFVRMNSYKVYLRSGRTIFIRAETYYRDGNQYGDSDVQFVRDSEVVAITFESMPRIVLVRASDCATMTFACSGTVPALPRW